MTAKQIKTAVVDKRDAENYWRRSQELFETMRHNLALGHWNAAVINGVHATISANDAITVVAIGKRSTSDHHLDAVALLEQAVSANFTPEAVRLRRILYIKSHVEYGPSLITEKEAKEAAQNVERFMRWAERTFKQLGSS